jgi:hypothetical protein
VEVGERADVGGEGGEVVGGEVEHAETGEGRELVRDALVREPVGGEVQLGEVLQLGYLWGDGDDHVVAHVEGLHGVDLEHGCGDLLDPPPLHHHRLLPFHHRIRRLTYPMPHLLRFTPHLRGRLSSPFVKQGPLSLE